MVFDWLADKLRSRIEGFIASFLKTPEAAKIMAQSLTITPTIWGDPKRIHLGKNVLLNNALLNSNSGDITIGDDSFCSHNSSIITGTHPLEAVGDGRHAFPMHGRDIVIGKGVWISTNAVVLGPCRIGNHAVIAAGSVVNGGEVPANAIFGGVPAKFIRNVEETT